MNKTAFLFLLLCVALALPSPAKSDTTNADSPLETFDSTRVSTANEYTLTVNGRSVPIYAANAQYDGGIYYFTSFDSSSRSTIRVTSKRPLDQARLLPSRFAFSKQGQTLTFEASKPFRIALERDGRTAPLIILANKPEKNAPRQGRPDVVYFGPGYHKVGALKIHAGQTLYLAEGAVVNGGVEAEGDNITICGRGILTGDGYGKYKGPLSYLLHLKNCHNTTVKDITLTNSFSWTFVMHDSRHIKIDNVKILCSNILNDDAIDVCNSQDVSISNCFLRTQDDIIAVKGHTGGACEDISIKDCEMWTDRANIFRIGYESIASCMRNIRAKNLEVLHYSRDYRLPDHYWSNAVIWLQPSNKLLISDIHFKNIRIHADQYNTILLEAKSCLTGDPATKGGYYVHGGSVRNVSVRNIEVYGNPSAFTGEIWLEGHAADENISQISMKNIRYFGKRITDSSPVFVKKQFVSDIRIK